MGIEIVDPRVEDYLRELLGGEHEIAAEMEEAAEGFPIVGRVVGVTLEVLARAVGARRVLELGSGFGYSAYWFARAVGADGEVHMTDNDPDKQARAADYLGRARLGDRVRSHVGEALDVFDELGGDFDVIFNDIDKTGYPEAWRRSRDRIRPGGLYLCDNVLWSGRVVEGIDDEGQEEITAAVLEHNRAVSEDQGFRSTIVPTRDGVMVAIRLAG
jgi:predicted O-methyltransferase YrrM